MGIASIGEKVRKLCPHWDLLDPVFGERSANRVVFASSAETNLLDPSLLDAVSSSATD